MIAAAFSFGDESGDLATLVKLVRVALLAPALLVLGVVTEGRGVRYSMKHPPVPWFVIGFLALGLLPPGRELDLELGFGEGVR